MRRNLSAYKAKFNGAYVFLGFFFLIYQILGSTFVYAPLLYGIFFCYMFCLLEERERTFSKLDFRWYFSLFFLFFTDITYNFFIFSSWLAFFIFYYLCADWIKTNLKIGKFIPVVFVLCAYGIILFLDMILSYIGDVKIKILGWAYIVSVFIECCLAYVFFKGKI
ncbi:hypothetical protein AT881_07040 [Campylobacter jejuni]|nr:hypothetical protein [Campylobacter jejuni]